MKFHDSILRAITKVVSLNSSEIEILKEKMNFKTYKKGELLVKQNTVCKSVNFIVSGCVKSSYLDQKGVEHVMFFAVKNWWAGDLGSFYSQTPANYNVACLEETEVICINYSSLEEIYRFIPKMERFFRILVQNAYVSLQTKMIQHKSLSTKERYLIFQKNYADIEQRVPQYLIASYLGVTKEFFSKMKKELFVNLD